MRKITRVLLGLSLCGLLYFGTEGSARADVFIPNSTDGTTIDTFTNVKIYGVTNASSDNPYGVTVNPCINGSTPPPNCEDFFDATPGAGGYELATVNFYSNGGFSIVETTPGPVTTDAPSGGTVSTYQLTNLSNPVDPPLGACPTNNVAFFTVSAALNAPLGSECTNPSDAPGGGTGWVFNGNAQAGGVNPLAYTGNGVFTAADNSAEVVFQLTPTPELPSLALFGSGLLVVGFFLRKRKLVAE